MKPRLYLLLFIASVFLPKNTVAQEIMQELNSLLKKTHGLLRSLHRKIYKKAQRLI